MRRVGIRVAIHSVFSVVATWPLVLWMDVGLPNGTETPGTVAYFNLWTLRWNQQQFGDLFRHYWDAPIFHPEPGAFALSEPQPLTGLVFTPISWITGNPVVAYNVILLLALTLNGIAAARLSRRLGAGQWPALLIGLLAQLLPFVHNELGVEQLAMVFPTLFLADAILAWAQKATWPRSLAIGGWLSATFLTCGYYGLFALVVLGPASIVLVRRDWFGERDWFGGRRLLQLVAAMALFAALCGPILIGQARYTSNYERSDSLILANSAEPRAYLTLFDGLPGAKVMPWLSQEAGGERLYPGTVLLGLALVGVYLIAEGDPEGRRRWAAATFLGVAILIAFGLSLGLRLDILGWHPYAAVRHLPGWKDLRSPFRTAVLVQAFLLPFAAVALDRLWRLWRTDPAAVAVAGVGEVDGVAVGDEAAADAGVVDQPGPPSGTPLPPDAPNPAPVAEPVGAAVAGVSARAAAPVELSDVAAARAVDQSAETADTAHDDTADTEDPADADTAAGSGEPAMPIGGFAPIDGDPAPPDGADEPAPPEPVVEPAVPAGPAEPAPPASHRPRWWRWWFGPVLAVLLVGAGIVEIMPMNQQIVGVPVAGAGTDWVDWLAADHDVGAGDGSVAMFPFPENGNYGSYEATTMWMLAGLDHHRPLVNGYSGLFPPGYDNLEQAMRNGFPSTESIGLLVKDRVSWVVVPRDWAEGDGKATLDEWQAVVQPVFTGQDMVIYSITPPA